MRLFDRNEHTWPFPMASGTVVKEGWLTKQGGLIKTWKKRWFTLIGNQFMYYTSPGVKESGSIDLTGANEIALSPECKKQPSFRISCKKRIYYMVAASQSEAESWVAALNSILKDGGTPVKINISLPAFQLIRLLGGSQLSKVFLAKRKSDNCTLVMKSYGRAPTPEDSAFIEKVNTNLTNQVIPFVTTLAGVFTTEKSINFVSDFVKGVEYIPSEPIPESTACFMISQILAGLDNLHSKGFFYGDFHPSNVLIDKKGYITLSTAGIPAATATSSPYLSPSRAKGQPAAVEDDFYAAGIILFEMLCGFTPSIPINFPQNVSANAKAFINSLLNSPPASMKDLQASPFMSSVNLQALVEKTAPSPIVPTLSEIDDLGNDGLLETDTSICVFIPQ